MKVSSLFLLLVAFSIFPELVYAQPFGQAAPGYRIVKLVYNNKSGEQGTTHFFYNQQGLLWRSFWALDNGSRSSENRYAANTEGNIVSTLREYSDGLVSNEIFRYEQGLKIHEAFHQSDGRNGQAFYYYEEGYLSKAVYENYKGWLTAEIWYSYDQNKRLEKARILNSGKPVGTISYSYSGEGNLLRERWDFGETWWQEFTWEYAPFCRFTFPNVWLSCKPEYRIVKEEFDFNGETGGPSYYSYDEKGAPSVKEFIRSDGYRALSLFQYDSLANTVNAHKSTIDGGFTKTIWLYNADNRLVGRQNFKSDSLVSYESYFYDKQARLSMVWLQGTDGWLTGNIIIEEWLNEKPLVANFKSADGTTAIIRFSYKDGLLHEQYWEFSFGKYQVYRYYYESAQF